MDTVYIETSIISHATAWPSSNPATAVLQDQAQRWMDEQLQNYEVDADAASRRLAMLDGIPVLPANPDADTVADRLVAEALIPVSARVDAAHVPTAALAGVQYLLTQNCTHIANAHVLPRVYKLLDGFGLSGMLICTPVEFIGGPDDVP